MLRLLCIQYIAFVLGNAFVFTPIRFHERESNNCKMANLKTFDTRSLGIVSPIFTNSHKYPISRSYYETYIKRLNSKNVTIQTNSIMGMDEYGYENSSSGKNNSQPRPNSIRIIINKGLFEQFQPLVGENQQTDFDEDEAINSQKRQLEEDLNALFGRSNQEETRGYGSYGSAGKNGNRKSEHFEVLQKFPLSFKDVGGYRNIKEEMMQCIDILTNHTKYAGYNVRTPKGLILEGPPGNGKTLLAKAFAGEAGVGFIYVSGSEFAEKYVGVGASRVRELFALAKNNMPCVIFIDEMEALGRRRSSDFDSASSERDNTLNELLVGLDGFHNTSGIFVIGATNRADMLDPALVRPGRIDKRIFIGPPDAETREAIVKIHLKGKPHDPTIHISEIVEMTAGFSGAQIENLLNEALLYALRQDRKIFLKSDLETVINKIMVGWQPVEHRFTEEMIDQIAIHELGHAVIGMLCFHHANVTKIVINLSAPKTPAYTVFEILDTTIYTREALFEHLMILLSGRIAEEEFYENSVSTGAINDFEEALKLAEKMILVYGMGDNLIYPSNSEKYKEMIDSEVLLLLNKAYSCAKLMISKSKDLIYEGAMRLKKDRILTAADLINMMNESRNADTWELVSQKKA
jgi:cell division protease FtsH